MTLADARSGFTELDWVLEEVDFAKVFVKSSRDDIFGPEAEGLNALAATNAIRVARVVGYGTHSGRHFLVIEAIESSTASGDFFERFGRQLAETHRVGSSDQFGFHEDNFIGETVQPNKWFVDWCDFWAEQRLGFQLKLANENGYRGELQQLGKALIKRLDSLLGGIDEPPSLIHGDLWSGNWMCDPDGEPVLIDPAVYYANREAEFGMTTLFGGLSTEFYEAYNEAWPMKEGWRERVSIYRLYHLLNHLNLFGSSYLTDSLAILRRFS